MILDGKKVSLDVEKSLVKRLAHLKKTFHYVPTLATIQVGEDPASSTYVAMKVRACERVGLLSVQFHLPSTKHTADVLGLIQSLNENAAIDGILLQHPLPKNFDERLCFDAIALQKDVDGVTSEGFGRLMMKEKAFAAATPAGIMMLLSQYHINLVGKHAVVVGRSAILGKPMAAMLLNADATVTICHSKTTNLPQIIRTADIVIGAVGKPHFIQSEWIKPGAVIVDAGYHPALKIGDIEMSQAKAHCLAYTPVPGGVGPMTIAMLLSQTVLAAEMKFKIEQQEKA